MTRPAPESSTRTGLLAAVGAYGLWGVLPVFFLLLVPAGAFEIVGWRILFSLVVCAVVITAARRWGRVVAIVRRPRILLGLGLAGHLILVNWTVYVYGTLSGHVVETALGYFINPIVTVLLGVLLSASACVRCSGPPWACPLWRWPSSPSGTGSCPGCRSRSPGRSASTGW